MKNRAQRRNERDKALKRAFDLTHIHLWEKWNTEEERIRWAYRVYKHPKRCSCSMCGNPRRHSKGKHKLSLQEYKNKLDLQE